MYQKKRRRQAGYLPIHPSTYLSIYLFIYLSIYLSIYPYVYLSISHSLSLSLTQRCELRSSYPSYSGPVQGRLAGNRGGKKGLNEQSFLNSKKNRFPNHTPNHARTIAASYLKLPNSEPWFTCQGRFCVLWAQIFSSQPFATGYASCCFWEKPDSSSTLQRHPAMAPKCQLQSACAQHFNCSTLKQHPEAPPCSGTSGPAPERPPLF